MARFDLTDREWAVIAPLLPNKPRGVPRVDDRRVLNGIFWTLRTGSPWRDLPERYGPYTTAYNRYNCRATHQIDPLTTRGIDPSEDEEVQMHEIERHTPSRLDDARRDEMKTPEDVTAMARLKSLGWGARRIAVELGCSRTR